MAGRVRAGGHILGASGWEPEALADVPAEQEEEMPVVGAAETEIEVSDDTAATSTEGDQAATDAATTAPDTAADEDGEDSTVQTRAECPDCHKELPVNKDGSLRKHSCVPDEELET